MNITTQEIQTILENELPQGFNIIVKEWESWLGNDENIKIAFSPSTHEINGVQNQFPQFVSLNLNLTRKELKTQIFAGNGGGTISRKPNPNTRERFLAMKSEKVPFRKPKGEKKFILSAIERFCKNYLKTLKKHEGNLMYEDIVNYSFLDDVKI